MSLLNNSHFVILQGQLEKGNRLILHKLGTNRAAAHSGIFLSDKRDVLACLHDADLILASLGLDRDCKMATIPVDPKVQFVDLDLSNTLHGRPQVILQTVGRQSKESVDKAVVANNR